MLRRISGRRPPTWQQDFRFLLLYGSGALAITLLILGLLKGIDHELRTYTNPATQQR